MRDQGARQLCWINKTVLAGSVFSYGIPRSGNIPAFNALNLEPTLHDLVSWLGSHMVARLSYLEMGVSSLKNFDVQVNFFHDTMSVLSAMERHRGSQPKACKHVGRAGFVVRAIPSRRFNNMETKNTLPQDAP